MSDEEKMAAKLMFQSDQLWARLREYQDQIRTIADRLFSQAASTDDEILICGILHFILGELGRADVDAALLEGDR